MTISTKPRIIEETDHLQLAHVPCAFYNITGSIAGHLVNAFSSLIIQKWLFRKPFARAMDWRTRSQKNSPKRMDRIRERSFELYGLLPDDLKTFDLRIRGEEEMPQSFVTGFSFLSFYGMNRTLSLLCVLASVPSCELARRTGLLSHPAASVLLALALTVGSAALFLHQYLRFVEYYDNYLESILHDRKARTVTTAIWGISSGEHP